MLSPRPLPLGRISCSGLGVKVSPRPHTSDSTARHTGWSTAASTSPSPAVPEGELPPYVECEGQQAQGTTAAAAVGSRARLAAPKSAPVVKRPAQASNGLAHQPPSVTSTDPVPEAPGAAVDGSRGECMQGKGDWVGSSSCLPWCLVVRLTRAYRRHPNATLPVNAAGSQGGPTVAPIVSPAHPGSPSLGRPGPHVDSGSPQAVHVKDGASVLGLPPGARMVDVGFGAQREVGVGNLRRKGLLVLPLPLPLGGGGPGLGPGDDGSGTAPHRDPGMFPPVKASPTGRYGHAG
jgi:hypothetical protein